MSHRFRHLPRALVLGVHLPVAVTRRSRLRGLSHLSRTDAGAGLLIPHCRGVHTFGMRFPVDIVFLDARGGEIDRRAAVPRRRFVYCHRAAAVAELPSRQGGEQATAGS